MTSLYRIDGSADEIAAHFELGPVPDLAVPAEIEPGETGLIVRATSAGRVMQRPLGASPGRTATAAAIRFTKGARTSTWVTIKAPPCGLGRPVA